MTDDRAILDAIARAIASVPAARAPEAVLEAIREKHEIVPKPFTVVLTDSAGRTLYKTSVTYEPGDLES